MERDRDIAVTAVDDMSADCRSLFSRLKKIR